MRARGFLLEVLSSGHKKKRARGFLLELSIRGRLPAPSHVADHRRGGVADHRRGGAQGSVSGWDWRETKKETQIALSLPRGRLPTLPLSQYHRRGEA